MKTGRRLNQAILILSLCFGLLISKTLAAPTGSVSGVVVDADGAVANAIVRVRNTDNVTHTDEDGKFLLSSLAEGKEIEVTAWAQGYYIAFVLVTPPAADITLTLRPYHTEDNPDYKWVSPIIDSSEDACGNCHPMILPQWLTNAHGQAVSNPRFFSMYNGTDINGKQELGPGYLKDFPGTAGSCANCHAPGSGVDGYLNTNMNDVRDKLTAGIHCDYCHKIGGAYINPATRSVYPNAPGAQSQKILRPPEGDNIFFGPFDDIHDPDTYLPEISQSQFCAPCHQFSFWGTPIYESYTEWLNSSYAKAGVTCQDCHMPPTGETYFALPERGGLEHKPESIPSHLQLGAASTKLLQETVKMRLFVRWKNDQVKVSVALTNSGAGHHVPTDYPGRNMILVVRATDSRGKKLTQVGDPKVPGWGGDLAGLPGKGYAKILRDVITKEAPVINYWKQTLIDSDNRIPANETDISTFTFTAPKRGLTITVTAELRFRRLFQDMMKIKEWDTPDIVMAQQKVKVFTLPDN